MAKGNQRKDVKLRKPPRKHLKIQRSPEAMAKTMAAVVKALGETGNIRIACDVAGLDRRTYHRWHDRHPEFAQQCTDALEDATDMLEEEARRRAYKGYNKPVVYQGQITDWYKEYSDPLLALLLSAHRPSKFRRNVSTELSGPKGAPINIKSGMNVDWSKLSDEELATIQALLEKAAPELSADGED